jgi:xanthine dehydrogenase FAD-binding subunit
MMSIESYVSPHTLEEAAGILSQGGVTILAGGTDLIPQVHSGKLKFKPVLMNIRRVAELQGISLQGGMIRIGALASITDLLTSSIVRDKLPALAEAADHFASDQIRNAGTVGGSLCNASPAGDVAPPLMVYNAEVELVFKPNPNGGMKVRTLPLAEFFTGPGRTRMQANELFAAVRVPVPKASYVARFVKFGTRPALDISTISIAIGGARRGRALHEVRVVLGAVAPVPLRAALTEAALEGKELDAGLIDRVASTAHDEVKPISDVRASAWYRQELVHNIVKRMLTDVAQG